MTDYLRHQNDFSDPRLASVVDELSFWSARFGGLLFSHLPFSRGIRMLDIGCANGFPTFELAHVFGATCEVFGIDLWRQALVRAKSKGDVYALSQVHLVEADAARLPFTDAAFDLIVSNLGLNNWADPRAVLNECSRVARDGAKLALTTNLKGHYGLFYDQLREVLRELKQEASLTKLERQEAHRGTVEIWSDLLGETGWRVTRALEESFEMRFMDGTAMLSHALTKLGFLDGWRSALEPSREREIFGLVEARLNELAARRGELRLTVPMLYLEGAL